jgi:hypothetical protein
VPAESNIPHEIFTEVWRQALLENAPRVSLNGQTFAVRKTSGKQLKEVDFELDGISYRGLEQNPTTKSRWAELARSGAKVMQFLQAGKYVAVVVDEKLTHYSSRLNK